MVAMIRSPYFDPWTRGLFGEVGLKVNLHPKLDPLAQIGGVTGGVIMSKLGNETAKYAETTLSVQTLLIFLMKGSTWPCHMEATVSFILSDEKMGI